jgi:hypothetical protein
MISASKAFSEIELTLQFKDAYEFDYRKPPTYTAGPLIVTISRLKGSLTLGGTISVSCRLPDNTSYMISYISVFDMISYHI